MQSSFLESIQSHFYACNAHRVSGMHLDAADALSHGEWCVSCSSFSLHASLIHRVIYLLESIKIGIHV